MRSCKVLTEMFDHMTPADAVGSCVWLTLRSDMPLRLPPGLIPVKGAGLRVLLEIQMWFGVWSGVCPGFQGDGGVQVLWRADRQNRGVVRHAVQGGGHPWWGHPGERLFCFQLPYRWMGGGGGVWVETRADLNGTFSTRPSLATRMWREDAIWQHHPYAIGVCHWLMLGMLLNHTCTTHTHTTMVRAVFNWKTHLYRWCDCHL